jgi:hypothetical protein
MKALPCPFCGSMNLAIAIVPTLTSSKALRCKRCGSIGPTSPRLLDAIAAWSRRPERLEAPFPIDSLIASWRAEQAQRRVRFREDKANRSAAWRARQAARG